jgi:hypothetical protein
MISGGYRCPLYDDAAVTTTNPGSDQATHQLDNALLPEAIAMPEDIADAVAWLASDDAKFVTA